MSKKLISVIVPVYNEEENVERAYDAIASEMKQLPDLDYEIVFTDNHSVDTTFEKLSQIATRDPRARVLRFARNFGFHRSILTGYRFARGDAAIQIDCDLEDPTTVFPEFIRLWQAGHDVVIGVRAQRVQSRSMRTLRRVYYWLSEGISEIPHEVDAGDFRLVDRSILDQLRAIDDADPYVRGLVSELAKNKAFVRYARHRREHGKSKFPLKQLFRLGLDGIFSYSTTPLRLSTYLGIVIAILATLLSGYYIGARLYYGHEWPAGFATISALILFGVSLNAIFLGIIGEYVGRIYRQVRKRPTVIIEKAINIESRSHITQA